ncbi:MAG: GNAT family N-acetyltransferase [Anaerolineae bacterium]|nr:GNAT family N-acetyltransferase [Anaerolineae bacterium]
MSDEASRELSEIVIRPFTTGDQAEVRTLILAGLGEHWGWIDETKNPDVDHISAHYAGETFLIAQLGDQVVGTGALIHEQDGAARIVRMSVDKSLRRAGIGSRILRALIAAARQRGYQRIVLETTATWDDAIDFYKRHGFRVIGVWDGDMHFERDIDQEEEAVI